jgi:Domain of unknown function (DUF4157)/Bacterial protein of unknown function (DUF922)
LDFGDVRVHTGSDAVQMNGALNAQAFAHGSDIYFGAGKSPGNNELTAHELTHVVQQTGQVQSQAAPGGSPDASAPIHSSTTFIQNNITKEVHGATLSLVGAAMSSAGTGEAASVLPALKPEPQYEYDKKDEKVTKVAVTIVETKEMPVWAELGQQCQPIKDEWNRFYSALDKHEEEHVAIDRKHYKDVHRKMVGKPKAIAYATLDAVTEAANLENEAHDLSTRHGRRDGTDINGAVQCGIEKVSTEPGDAGLTSDTAIPESAEPQMMAKRQGLSDFIQPALQEIRLFGSKDSTEREKIDAALKSKDPGDVKEIKDINQATETEKLALIRILAYQGWVGSFDESKIENIWASFGDRLPQIAASEIVMWHHCMSVGADIDKLPAVIKVRDKFESDVKSKAIEYLNKNQEYILQEMQSLGVLKICIDGRKEPTKEEQSSRLKEIQEVATTVATAQKQVEQLKLIMVGYEVTVPPVEGVNDGTSPLYFDPDNPPPQGWGLTDEDVKNNNGRNWQEVYEQWKAPAGVITKAANLYPTLYSAIQESQPGVFADPDDKISQIADEKNPELALKTIADVLSATKTKIDESIQLLPNGKPAYYKLDPIHRQFLAGLPGTSGTDWSGNNFNKWVANQDLNKNKERDYWIDIGLKTAASAAFIAVELASAGTATFFIGAGIGLAATGTFTAMAWDDYVSLARTSKTNVKDDTALVDRKQVIDAEAKALAATAQFIAMFLAVGIKGVSGLQRKVPDEEKQASKEKEPSQEKEPLRLPEKGTRQKPTFDRRLASSDEAGMEHLDHRHASWSKEPKTSKFTNDAWNNIKPLVEETVERGTIGHVKPNAAGSPQAGVVYECKFSTQTGTSDRGKKLYRIRVVVDANNHVTTAFPF